jgi:hypothetical protein
MNRPEDDKFEVAGAVWLVTPMLRDACKIARNTDPLRGDFASNSDPS